ncbi:PTS lactose/cellobiose transporter subunit IIA [Erysipelotrichaceae bacterium HCN-30851]
MIIHEKEIFELILNSGDARTLALKSLEYARENCFDEALECIQEAGKKLNIAHKNQVNLIQDEINGEESSVSLLMVHAQDHLMNSMTVRDLAKEIVLMKKSDIERGG